LLTSPNTVVFCLKNHQSEACFFIEISEYRPVGPKRFLNHAYSDIKISEHKFLQAFKFSGQSLFWRWSLPIWTHLYITIWMYNCILVLKTSGVQCCSSSCVVERTYPDITIAIYRRVLVLESPNTSRTQSRSSQQQLIVALNFHSSCLRVFGLWYLAEQACSGIDILQNMFIQVLISNRQSVFWHWYLTEQACSGTGVLHNKSVLAMISCTKSALKP
jgi:hypothetical protein